MDKQKTDKNLCSECLQEELYSDYCLFCGELVHQDDWREHMRAKHSAVLVDNPRDRNGVWKKPYQCRVANKIIK